MLEERSEKFLAKQKDVIFRDAQGIGGTIGPNRSYLSILVPTNIEQVYTDLFQFGISELKIEPDRNVDTFKNIYTNRFF